MSPLGVYIILKQNIILIKAPFRSLYYIETKYYINMIKWHLETSSMRKVLAIHKAFDRNEIK